MYLLVLTAHSVAAVSKPERIDPKIREMVRLLPSADYSTQDDLGFKLLEAIDLARPGDIAPATIELIASMLVGADGHVRVILARALGEIGPEAERALPKLQKAFDEDEKALRQLSGIAVGGETPYEAEQDAIRHIKGQP